MKRIKFRVQMDIFKSFLSRNMLVVGVSIFILFLGSVLLPKAFAQPVKSVEIISDSVSFEEKDPGAWKVDKSAKWTSKGEAEITFDVDTIMKTNKAYTDVLLVLDVSGSMDGDKLNRVKTDSIELIESLLSTSGNKLGLISFSSDSKIILDFTDDKEQLIDSIDDLSAEGRTNYYGALVNVDEVLNNYKKQNGRDCVVLFLSDGYPNEDTPNEAVEYEYLAKKYPFITINGIQYEMGNILLNPIKNVSDRQFIANMDTLGNVLFEASTTSFTYDNFEITDYINTDYFYVDNKKDIKVDRGNVIFDRDNQKVTWTINEFKSGLKARMTIGVKLRDEYISEGGEFSTNSNVEIKSEIEDAVEDVESSKTPVLSNKYKVVYDENKPAGCNMTGSVPNSKSYFVYDTVGLSSNTLSCDNYQFRGWEIETKGVVKINDDNFIMPEDDVVIRARWAKLFIEKKMDGEVHEYVPATLERYEFESTNGLHKYNDSITDIIFQNSMSSIGGAIDVIDISAEKNNGILAYIVPNEDDSTKYTAYIQGDSEIVANEDSSFLFSGFVNLKSIQNLEHLNTSNVTSMNGMFYDCNSLINLDLSGFDTSKVTSMSTMFYNCTNLLTLNLSNFDTANVTDLAGMFYKCSSLTNLDLSSFDTSKVTTMASMFRGCSVLTNMNFGNKFNTSSVANMFYMFCKCSSLTEINLNNLDTSKVTDMEGMFYGCSSLVTLDIKINTSRVTTMRSMFYGCSNLTNLDLSGFDTSNVTTMYYMFSGCAGLISLDLSNFDTSKVTNMHGVFYDCSSLTSVNLSNFNTSKVTLMSGMFMNCVSLLSLDLSSFDTSNVTEMISMFRKCSSLTNLNVTSFNTSNVTSMFYMFFDCSSLTSLDVSRFKTTNVTDMNAMFYNCVKLTSLDVSGFNTSIVTTMKNMFYNCSGLTSLDVSNFDTSVVTDMSSMFRKCGNLTSLDLSGFNTSNATTMYYMFAYCSNLTSLNVSSFNTSSVTTMEGMFGNCNKLASLDVSNFDTSKVTDMGYMFAYSSKISTLELSEFNTSNVVNMEGLFAECTSLKSLDLSSFNTSKVTTMKGMFHHCSALESLDLSNFDTSKVTDMYSMFYNCNSLVNLNLSSFDTSNVTIMDYAFYGCYDVKTSITISNVLTNYYAAFNNAATSSDSSIVVNYTENVSSVIDKYIATRTNNSNVVKGELIAIGT